MKNVESTAKLLANPKHWPSWALVAQLRALALLPHGARMRAGAALGEALQRLAKDRPHVAEVNVKLCLPHLTSLRQQQIVDEHFQALGKTLIETPVCWWGSDDVLPPCEISGREHLESALAAGKGALLVSAHFTALEMGARLLAREFPIAPVYRQHENPVFEKLMAQHRGRHTTEAIPRGDVRAMLRATKANHAVWFATDQAPNYDQLTALVPFFGHPAKTMIATSRIAKLSKAAVIPFYAVRASDDSHYKLTLLPALENFPSDDPVADTTRLNKLIEAQIRKTPAQYLWTHKRFKRRGEGLPDPY